MNVILVARESFFFFASLLKICRRKKLLFNENNTGIRKKLKQFMPYKDLNYLFFFKISFRPLSSLLRRHTGSLLNFASHGQSYPPPPPPILLGIRCHIKRPCIIPLKHFPWFILTFSYFSVANYISFNSLFVWCSWIYRTLMYYSCSTCVISLRTVSLLWPREYELPW